MEIQVNNLTKIINEKIILDNLSFKVLTGEVLSIIGPSGAGKSTVLKCMSGLTKIDNGAIKPQGIKVGMVFQNFNLFANKTVIENVSLAPRLVDGLSKSDANNLAEKLLKKVKLLEKANAYPAELSGGQMQRVAIARALARNPEVMLFDEPTSALDPELTFEVLEIIKKLTESKSLIVIIVTHEINFAKKISDKMIFMEKGMKLYDGKPSFVLSRPRVMKFIENMN